ncbi:hypothetical protein C1I97_22730 [Streptomyces sp. NTH33]|nr:hypothetical protein C1I97_22730 [Streptomyces sp. NTH33]
MSHAARSSPRSHPSPPGTPGPRRPGLSWPPRPSGPETSSQTFMITVVVPMPAPDPASRRPAQTPELQLPCLNGTGCRR